MIMSTSQVDAALIEHLRAGCQYLRISPLLRLARRIRIAFHSVLMHKGFRSSSFIRQTADAFINLNRMPQASLRLQPGDQ